MFHYFVLHEFYHFLEFVGLLYTFICRFDHGKNMIYDHLSIENLIQFYSKQPALTHEQLLCIYTPHCLERSCLPQNILALDVVITMCIAIWYANDLISALIPKIIPVKPQLQMRKKYSLDEQV